MACVEPQVYDGGMAKKEPAPRTPRGTNVEVVGLWMHDWLSDVPETVRITMAKTLCYRLGVDPEGRPA